jgi:citrate synthase
VNWPHGCRHSTHRSILINLINMMEWIDRAEALALLGVKPQTLYAYVSRGRIEVRRETSGARRSLYRAEDVAALARRAEASRKPSAIASESLAWGEASIVTRISTVQRGRLIYRSMDAASFSAGATLEDAARLLWGSDADIHFPVPTGRYADAFAALAELAARSPASIGRSAERLCRDAGEAVGHIAAACGIMPGTEPLHQRLAASWSLSSSAAGLVRRGLVLVADHELNASTFAARVAASTGASMAACLLAGLSALSGPKHGGATAALAHMLDDARRNGVDATVRAWLERGIGLPGFGHPLYPNGDIRALTLSEGMQLDPLMRELAEGVWDAASLFPNIDFALVALARAAKLPANAPFQLFMLGRSVGWAAHAMEQALKGRLIRPRARYEGVMPIASQ